MPDKEFFEQKVMPLLKTHCYGCHSHASDSAEGGLVLDSRSGWEVGGDSGPAVIPGEPDSSLLLKAITYTDDELRMPPDGRLTNEQISAIRKWIGDGAADSRKKTAGTEFDRPATSAELWSLKPLQVDGAGRDSIDAFIRQHLTAAKLSPGPQADKATLLRRATFDLTGLPPSPEAVASFVSDERPDAWKQLINDLLDRPEYGERWGRHWLDLARYGDSNGGDINYAHANAWRYRDYVIRAFNADKPYDDFIREQLAGDLLAEKASPERRAELLTATGFLMLGPKMLAEVDGDKLLIDIVDEQLDITGKTFLGMTFGCARCHDHKFDPVTTQDYYAMAGIFRSTKVMDSLRPDKVVGEWIEVDVTLPEIRRKIDALKTEQENLEGKLAALGQPGSTDHRDPNFAPRAIVAPNLPEINSTTWAARVRVDVPQNLGAVISADYKGAAQGHSLGFDRRQNGLAPRVVWNHNRNFTIITAPRPVSRSEWHHLAVTYDAESRRLALYVDGEPSASAEDVSTTPFRTISAGRREAAKQFQLIGDVDDVIIYDTALTQEEIVLLDAGQQLAHRPILHWDFDAIANDQVVDVVGSHASHFAGTNAQSAIVDDGFRGQALSLRPRDASSHVDNKQLADIRSRLQEIGRLMPEPVKVMAVQSGTPTDLPIHIRGSHTNTARRSVARTTPVAFASHLPPIVVDKMTNGRLELANWIADPRHPLTARVMVNRIWQHHFGVGLVSTPSNFGTRGEKPSHPKLLDWLARRFIESGWSVKKMHRLIMMSAAYQRSSHVKSGVTDAELRLLANHRIRRLDAEAIRDSLLTVSAELRHGTPGSLMTSPNMKRVAMTPNDPAYDSLYRGVYLPAVRVRGYEMFSIFDVTDNGQHIAARPQTMVAQQALFLLNNPFVSARVNRITERVMDYPGTPAEKISWLFVLLFGRDASTVEKELLLSHYRNVDSQQPASTAWQSIVHSLICSNEFIYLQ